MNRTLLLLLAGFGVVAQAMGQPCGLYARLMEAGEKFQSAKKYKEALNKYNAAKLCDPAKAADVDARVQELFDAIEGEKQEAVRQRYAATAANQRAERATALAQRQALEARALYWASESDKLEPTQALRLLERALRDHPTALPIEERLFKRFHNKEKEVVLQRDLPHPDRVELAVFSPDGNQVLTVADSVVYLWNCQGKLRLSHVIRPRYNIQSSGSARFTASFSATGKRLLVTDAYSADLWDNQGRHLKTLNDYDAALNAAWASFSPDGNRVVTQNIFEDTVTLWDSDGDSLATLPHENALPVVFAPDGERFLTVSRDGTARLWNRHGNFLKALPVSDSALEAYSAAFSPDGNRLLTQVYKNEVRFWNRQGDSLATLLTPFILKAARWLPSDNHLLTVDYDTVSMRDDRGRRLTVLLHDDVDSAYCSPDGKRLVTVSKNQTKFWDRQGNLLATHRQTDPVVAVKFSPEPGGHCVLMVTDSGKAQLWTDQGRLVARLSKDEPVGSAFFAPGGNRLLTVGSSKNLKVWDCQGALLATCVFTGFAQTAKFSPDGERLLTTSNGGERVAKLWQLQNPFMKEYKQEVFSSMADGIRATDDVTRWRKRREALLKSLPFLENAYQIALSPDGNLVLTVSGESQSPYVAKLWNLRGQMIGVFPHGSYSGSAEATASVAWAVFSPDGTSVFTTGGGHVKVWHTIRKALQWLRENDDQVAPLSDENRRKYGVPK